MRGVSLPITAIVVIALGLLVMVVLAAAFIKGGAGFVRTQKTQQLVQECQNRCNFFKQIGQDWEGNVSQFNRSYYTKLQYYAQKCLDVYPCKFEIYDADIDEYVSCGFEKNSSGIYLVCSNGYSSLLVQSS